MKVTVICKGSEWQVEQLKKRAKELAIDLEMQNIENSQALPHNLGEVVLWRSSSLGVGKERLKMMGMILEKHILINRCLMRLPHATEKAFQQSYVQEKTKTIPCISTFQFSTQEAVEEALREGILRYPFIQKPDKGSKGQGVELITDKKDLERVFTSERPQVYQNFIRNSGDYRVLVLGGRMLGAIKRTATEGNFLNNISKGGVAKEVTDPQVLSKLRRIATTIASIFELTFCGVDVIYDEATKKYFFLEVNTVPQWKGFQTATGIDVAGEILSYCQRLVARKEKNTFSTVYDEYHSQVHLLRNKQFHFLSRLYAWTEKDQYKVFLDALRKKYIGATTDEYRETLKNIFSQKREHGDGMVAKALREKFFTKYPSLEPALDLLFKYLFAKKIYAVDLRPYIQELVKKNDLVALKEALDNDPVALRALSTHAINYLYLLDAYLATKKSAVSPQHYLEIGRGYPEGAFELQLYFFTHCIIGASQFYTEAIPPEDLFIYREMLRLSEKIIKENFKKISLDNKCEFLVCARMCHYIPSIEPSILHEVDQSISQDGNFLIDICNAKASPDERNDLIGAEHRNVLYLMSQMPSHYSAKDPLK